MMKLAKLMGANGWAQSSPYPVSPFKKSILSVIYFDSMKDTSYTHC